MKDILITALIVLLGLAALYSTFYIIGNMKLMGVI